MHTIYAHGKPVWSEVNLVAQDQLDLDQISDDISSYVLAVLGIPRLA
jgi:hypothetical protein